MPLINRVRGAKKLVSIIILTAPTTTTYKYGTAFNPAGMVVQAIYSNGKIETITDYTYSPTGALTHSTSAVTISYTEKKVTATVQQEITVTPTLSSIAITTQPTTKTYEYGNTFSTSGMVVTATYSNSSTKKITNYTYTPTSTLTTLGSQTVTVSYTEDGITKTATTSITVERKSVAIPSQSGTLTYNGSAQSPSWTGYNTTYMTISGTTSGTNATTYYATFTPKSNYRWTDGTTAAKNVSWSIAKATGSLSISPTSLSLTTSSTSKTIAVTRAGNGTITATSSNTSIATVSVSGTTVTVTGKANGSCTITVKVAAGTNHTAPSNKTCSVSSKVIAQFSKYGSATSLSVTRNQMGAASNPSYGIFAGGYAESSSSASKAVDAYNSSLTRKTSTLSSARAYSANAQVGNYAIFAGGHNFSSAFSSTEVFNTSLTRSSATSLGAAVYNAIGVSVGNYALIVGGNTMSALVKTVYTYNTSLTRSTATQISAQTNNMIAASVGNYAIIGGGWNSSSTPQTRVYAYNASLTRSLPTAFTQGRLQGASASTTNYAIFAGGCSTSQVNMSAVANMDSYNSNLTKTTTTSFPYRIYWTNVPTNLGAGIQDQALFPGGTMISGSTDSPDVTNDTATVHAFNSSLTRYNPEDLTLGTYQPATVTIGNYVLVAICATDSGWEFTPIVDVYTL